MRRDAWEALPRGCPPKRAQNALIHKGVASAVWKIQLSFFYFFHKCKTSVRPRRCSCSVTQAVMRSDQPSVPWVEAGWPRPFEQTGPFLSLPVSSSACGLEAQVSLTTGKPNPLATRLFPPQKSSPWEDRGLQDSHGASRVPCVWRRSGRRQGWSLAGSGAPPAALGPAALGPAAPCLPSST